MRSERPRGLAGVPWHIEVLKKDDDQRHRSRCIYYNREDKYCRYHIEQCRGSSHCEYYKEYDPGEKSDKPNAKRFHQKKKGTLKAKDLEKSRLAKNKNTSAPVHNGNKQKKETNMGFGSAANNILRGNKS